MRSFLVEPIFSLNGEISLPGDKSIAHRSIIISAITQGRTTIQNLPTGKDCLYTLRAFKKLGIKIAGASQKKNKTLVVFGKGLWGLRKPRSPVFIGDSGTTLRLILGVLAGQNFGVTLTVGKSLAQRPMLRVTTPLRMMGAVISAKHSKAQGAKQEEYPPLTIKGGMLRPVIYKMPIASAQVKSAILLAGLYTKGTTKIIEPVKTRDHTERMLKLFRADIKVKQNTIVIRGNKKLTSPGVIMIPGDISSASFFVVLTAILPEAYLAIKNVSLNASRIGVINVLKRMGADIEVHSSQCSAVHSVIEPMGDLIVRSSRLKGTLVKKTEVPFLIDEIPVLMVAACFAEGRTIFEGIGELRVKETDRILSMTDNLRKMGARIKVIKTAGSEKIIITGVKSLRAAKVRSFGDHRTAMSMIVAGLRATGQTLIDDVACIKKSFPGFLSLLKTVIP